MDSRQARIQELLALLADRSRFRMLCALAGQPTHVTELAARVGLSQSCATRHVQALAGAGAVECRRDGKRVIVRVCEDDPIVATLLAWVAGDGEGAPAERAVRPRALPIETRTAREARDAAPRHTRRDHPREEVAPAAAPDSGTPAPTHEEPRPVAPARIRALEDFLL